jgi:acetyltransferase EpsM
VKGVSRSLLIWGAGGHAKVVRDLATDQGWVVVGYIDRDVPTPIRSATSTELNVIEGEDSLKTRLLQGASLPAQASGIALGIGNNSTRFECGKILGSYAAPPLIHSRAAVSPSALIGIGSVLLAAAVVNADTTIGRWAIINSGAIVEHDCRIADAAHISPGAVLTGGVSVGPLSWVGAGVVVLPGVTIGARTVIGAGAVVTRDVEDDVVVAGIPARIVRRNQV